jgi:membrane protease YdiL (CAAX protease family)
MTIASRAVGALVLYAAAYAGAVAVLRCAPEFEPGEALAVMLIFGLGLSLAAWLATARGAPAPVDVRAPARELGVLCAYLALFAVAFLGWGLSALKAAFPSEPAQSLVILISKLAAMVAIPGWLFTRLGYAWRDLLAPRALGRSGRIALLVIGLLLLALQLTVGRGPKALAALEQPAWQIVALAPFALAWLTIEAGLTEEFFFRALFQARAAAWLRSETAGIVSMALAFSLAHAPGYVLRGAHAMEGMRQAPNLLTAAAYTIVVVSPVGLMFGVLWARTRNLWLIVLLHGWGDLVPNLAPFVQTWTGH